MKWDIHRRCETALADFGHVKLMPAAMGESVPSLLPVKDTLHGSLSTRSLLVVHLATPTGSHFFYTT